MDRASGPFVLLAFFSVGAAGGSEFAGALARLDASTSRLTTASDAGRLDELVDDAIRAREAIAGPDDARVEAAAVVEALVRLAHANPEGGVGVEDAGGWLIEALPQGAGPLRTALHATPWKAFVALPDRPDPDTLVATLAVSGVPVNPRLSALDALGPAIAAPLRAVQPAVVRVWGDGGDARSRSRRRRSPTRRRRWGIRS